MIIRLYTIILMIIILIGIMEQNNHNAKTGGRKQQSVPRQFTITSIQEYLLE